MVLELVLSPDQRLKRISTEIPREDVLTQPFQEFLDSMVETMKANGGIGLAAPQVGKNIRVLVLSLTGTDHDGDIVHMVNPKIFYRDRARMAKMKEGCLSFPGQEYKVQRPQLITVKFYDRTNKEQIQLFTGTNAVCIQHEIDHLDGITFDTIGEKVIEQPKKD